MSTENKNKSLEDAAKEYADKWWNGDNKARLGFKAGWQAQLSNDAVEFAEFTRDENAMYVYRKGIWQAYPYTDESPELTTEQLYQLFKNQQSK